MALVKADIISYIRSVKHVYIVFSVDLDPIITSSALLRLAREEDVEVYLAPFYSASRPVDADSNVLLVKVLQRVPVGGLRIADADDLLGRDPKTITSSTMHLVKEVKKQIVIPRYIELLSLVAMVSLSRGSIYDNNVLEIHKQLLSEAVDKNLYSVVDSLRLFGYPKRDVIEALAKTVDPYILGVSLDYGGSAKVLEEVGGSIASEDSKAKLIEVLNSRLSSYCRSCESIVGPKIVLKNGTPIEDVYETAYALYGYMDLLGPDPLVSICMDSRVVEVAKGVFSYSARALKDLLNYVIEKGGVKKVIIRSVRVGIVDMSTVQGIPPLYVAHRVLRSLGLTEDVTVFTNGKEYLLPLQFVSPRWPYDRELQVEKGVAIFESLQEVGEVFK